MVEQIAVARDDRTSARGQRKRDEVVVVGIAKDARRVARIAELHTRTGDLTHGTLRIGGIDAVEEVGPREPTSDLAQRRGQTTASK